MEGKKLPLSFSIERPNHNLAAGFFFLTVLSPEIILSHHFVVLTLDA